MLKHVLLVEDDLSTQLTLKQMLTSIDANVEVDCAQSTEGAYAYLNSSGSIRSGYDLVVCDLNLPGLDGLVLWDYCQKRMPDLEFLFVSGASEDEWCKRVRPHPSWPAFMRKPVKLGQLRRFWEDRFYPLPETG